MEVEIAIMSSDKMILIREPAEIGHLDVCIMLPNVSILKPTVDRFKALGKILTISATMSGDLKLEIVTPAAKCQVVYDNLTNPNIRKSTERK